MHVCATAVYLAFTVVLCGLQDVSVSWSAVHILLFVRFIMAATCYTPPGLAHYFQDQERHMELTLSRSAPSLSLAYV